MAVPTEDELTDAIADATRRAVTNLFRQHPEHFYYCSLITSGHAHPPVVTAWSREALEAVAAKADDPEQAKDDLKWSYGESPYFCYGEIYFEDVARLFGERPQWTPEMTLEESAVEYDVRLRAMERAMARLDQEGVFGTGDARIRIVVNVEVMPPDYTNTERALRLNPKQACEEWLAEVAEPL